MSWFTKARELVVKFGPTVGTAVKHVAAFVPVPGAAAVGDLVESALKMGAEVGKDRLEAEAALKRLATEQELARLAAVFDTCLGDLGRLVEAVQLHDGDGDEAIEKLILTQMATDQAVREGFGRLSLEVRRFERIERKIDDVLHSLGYSGDLQASLRLLIQQQQAMGAFVEDLRANGVSGKQLAELSKQMHAALAAMAAGKAEAAAPVLQKLEAACPRSAAVAEAEAVQAVLSGRPKRAAALVTQAAAWRPRDERLAGLSRDVTRSADASDTGGTKADGDAWRRHFRVGAVIDGWSVTGLLGEGGMGSVFAVERGGEERAMKVLPPALSNDPAFAAQFRKEILVLHGLRGLRHVVAFHDFGRDVASGCWYFHMRRVRGESLQTKLDRDGPMPVAEAVALVRALAGEQGLAAVHARGVTHRDVKPGNVLIAADGTPVLVDFGIAGAGDPNAPTQVRAYTARFASPEQLRQEALTAASDVWSLAGLLWYVVTKTHPHEFDADEVPAGLEALREVLTKGLHDKRAKRLADAVALAAMLGEVSAAKTASASAPAKRANVKMPDWPPGRWPWEMAATRLHTLSGHGGDVCDVAFSPDGRSLATAAWDQTARVWETLTGRLLRTLTGHGSNLYSVAFSPDGRSIATGSADHTARVWEAASGKHLGTLTGHRGTVRGVAFSPSGRVIATASSDHSACLWEAATGRHLRTLVAHERGVHGVAFSPDERLILTVGEDDKARLWEVTAGRQPHAVAGQALYGKNVAFSPDSRLIVTAWERTARVWDAATGMHLLALSGHEGSVHGVAFSPDGRLIATASWDSTVRVWEAVSGKHLLTLSGHQGPVNGVAFSPDSRLIASSSDDDTAIIWHLRSARERPNWGHTSPTLPPKTRLDFTTSGDGVVYPGDLLWVAFRLENAGRGDLERLWAELRSPSKMLHGLATAVGKVGPGEVVERCLAVVLPTDMTPGDLDAELAFHDAHGEFTQSRPLRFSVRPLPRPDFPVRLRLVNDGSGNSRGGGDGRPRRGEWVDVVVEMENRTGEDLSDVSATLGVTRAVAGVEVKVPKDAVGGLADGACHEARLTVRVAADAASGVAAFAARVVSGDGRTFAAAEVAFDVA